MPKEDANMVILHEVKLVPEAIAEGTNGRIVISSLATLVYKHIPIAQSIAEHCIFFQNGFLSHKFGVSVANVS